MTDSNLLGNDERLKKVDGRTTRGIRENADSERLEKDGSALSAAERRAMLRRDWVQEVLPTPPEIQGFHTCWLSTTASTDSIYKRMQIGYTPVTMKDVPGFNPSLATGEGEFEGCVACNEMLLFKIPMQTYQDMMAIYHHDMPQEQEGAIYERATQGFEEDRNGKSLGIIEGDFNKFGRTTASPTFA